MWLLIVILSLFGISLKDEPGATAPPPTLEAKKAYDVSTLRELQKKHSAEVRAFHDAYRAARKANPQHRYDGSRHPDRAWGRRYAEFAKRARGEAAAQAWVQVARLERTSPLGNTAVRDPDA